jgi:hypothetical protein
MKKAENGDKLYDFLISDKFRSQLKKMAEHAMHTDKRAACDINRNGNSYEYVKMFHEMADFNTKPSKGYKSFVRVDIYPKKTRQYVPSTESLSFLQAPEGKILITGSTDAQINIELIAMKTTRIQKTEQLEDLDMRMGKMIDSLEIDKALEQQGFLVRRLGYVRNGNELEIGKANKYMFNNF